MDSAESSCCQWKPHLAWLAAALVVGLAVGYASGALQQAGRSLFLLQPLAVGAVVAVLLIGVGSVAQRRIPWWSALVAGVAIVVTQHVWLYRAVMAARRAAADQQAAVELFKPGWSQEGFFSYLWDYGGQPNKGVWGLAEWPNAALWGIDACLVILSAAMIVWWAARAANRSADQSMMYSAGSDHTRPDP